MMQQVEQYLTENSDRFVQQLKNFLSIASISADSAFRAEMQQGANFVRDQLAEAGLETEIVETEGHPIVFGSWLKNN